MNPTFYDLAARGMIYQGVQPQWKLPEARIKFAADGEFACDAQPGLITVSNAGIPAYLSTFVDPKIIDVVFAPMKAAQILGEAKKGDWTTRTASFTMAESTGSTVAYTDFGSGGRSDANLQFPNRQSFHYQTITEWGAKQLEEAGLARVDWANQMNVASVLVLNKYQNQTYFNGVAGIKNYGLLNDPNLTAAVTPITKAATGTSWSVATAKEILQDVQKLFKQLVAQTGGTVDTSATMTLIISPTSQIYLTTPTDFVAVAANVFIKAAFPNLRIETAPEYSTGSGELAQLIVDTYEGQPTATCAFTEKLRAHPVITDLSSYKQKKSQGTWGTVIFRPAYIAQMLGI